MDANQLVLQALEEQRATTECVGSWRYLRFPHRTHGIPRGTAVFDGDVIWGYPEIGRILRLEAGIREQFRAPFWVEEKVDGYNVRVFQHRGQVLALTRRGYLCPFTTDRLPDLLPLRIFAEHPDLVLCAEVAGPENPYNESHPPYVTEDVQLFVFDMMRKNDPHFVPHGERLALQQAYGLPSVPHYGRFELRDLERLKALLRWLNAEGREGIVLKEDSPRDQRAKYVTANACLHDIQVTAMSLLQLPPEFYTQRLLRLVLFLDEAELADSPALCAALGEAFIAGLRQALAQYRQHHKVFRTFRCRFRQEANAQLFIQSLRRLLGHPHVRQRRLAREGAWYVLEFDKVLPKETSMLGHLLGGGMVFD
ncbi:MAG: RNA ligase [Candidatus Tectimicrobiota bacterium]|nr:MAG: RNA ligase [Candidatus Tectomicrobia bacterium]